MIHSWALDCEIFPNLFSVGFVNLRSYLDTFKDCVDNKGHPKALTECLTVAEIEERLSKVERKKFYISDTNDEQLLDLVAFINQMQAGYKDILIDGEYHQEPVRWDIYGFNNQAYDDLMIKAFLMYFNRFDSTKELIKKLYQVSKRYVDLQNDKDAFYADREIDLIRKYRLPYITVDVFKIFALNSAGVNIDKDSGERVKFAKGLKQTSINLKWHNLLDFVLPPIDEEEYNLYWSKQANMKSLTIDELNRFGINDFDRYVLPKYVEHMLEYNFNDVYLVCEIVRQMPDEVKLRYSLGASFKLELRCSARSDISNKLLEKYYSKLTGLHPSNFRKLRTERTRLSFNKIIFPHIKFKTKQLQDLLKDMMEVYVYKTNKDAFSREINFYDTTYTIACGGIHTKDVPVVLKSTNDVIYKHFDYNSYYPSIVIAYNIYPKHLVQKPFVEMVRFFRDTRVKCKHTPDSEGYIINGVPNKLSAEALKIVINAIYGKFGDANYWLYDRFAQLQVTINGQLMTMTLVEELELNGIHVISANTDGLIIRLPKDKEEIFKEITERWNKTNKMNADSEDYSAYYARDVNNYFAVWTNGKVDAKGALDPKQYIKELKKGYDMPIVAKAVYDYFINNIPVMDTLRNHTDILDFCKTQNIGKKFNIVYDTVVNGEVQRVRSQNHVRFYVSTKGVIIQKQEGTDGKTSRLASGNKVQILNKLDDKPIEERNINYKYYYDEAYKIIDPIMLGVSPNQKGGKRFIKRNSKCYSTLFDEDEFE